jgi:hypothetical protein
MTGVTWLSFFAAVLSVIAIFLGYVAIGIGGLVFFPLAAWFDYRLTIVPPPPDSAGGEPIGPDDDDDPPSPRSGLWRRGPSRGGGGGARVPSVTRPPAPRPSGAQALPLPEE